MKTRHRIRIWSLSSVVKVKVKLLSHVRLFVTPWTVAYQASPSMGFSRQEYWSGLPFPSPVDLPDPGIKPGSPALQADTLMSEPPGKPKCLIAEETGSTHGDAKAPVTKPNLKNKHGQGSNPWSLVYRTNTLPTGHCT